MSKQKKQGREKLRETQKTVKLKLSQGGWDPTIQEALLVLIHHQEALIELLIQKGVFSLEEFESRVEEEIERSLKV
ncbi:MAG: hypothetical protein D6785_12055 [Planctomycetota bacterium]|nr:MAG: hypothetical protein D6785_12055 [Planctomycetota bacterium]